jgi:hypothetical protein
MPKMLSSVHAALRGRQIPSLHSADTDLGSSGAEQ